MLPAAGDRVTLQSCARGGRGIVEDTCYLCMFILQYLLQSCSREWGSGIVEDMCYERRRAETLVD
jgi:hypothetical protein